MVGKTGGWVKNENKHGENRGTNVSELRELCWFFAVASPKMCANDVELPRAGRFKSAGLGMSTRH